MYVRRKKERAGLIAVLVVHSVRKPGFSTAREMEACRIGSSRDPFRIEELVVEGKKWIATNKEQWLQAHCPPKAAIRTSTAGVVLV